MQMVRFGEVSTKWFIDLHAQIRFIGEFHSEQQQQQPKITWWRIIANNKFFGSNKSTGET